MNIAPGRSLLHYTIVEKLGEGGMGVVWKARDTTLDRDVAIKVLPDVFAGDEDRLARFQREAKVLASLTHPGIAGIYGLHTIPRADAGESADMRFLALECVTGDDLDARIAAGPMPVEEVLGIGRQLCAALGAAHESGIIHRDLKPANIRLTPEGQVKVLDFGLAKALAPDVSSGVANPALSPTLTSAGTLVGTILGTAGYMSPEQARGRAADKRADVWAFGVVLYELLVGRRMFEGDTVSDTLAAVLRQQPEWDALPAATPLPLRRLLRRCLEKDPTKRLRDIADAGIEIEDAFADLGRPPDNVAIAGGAPRSRALRAVPWALALVAALAAAWFALQEGGAVGPPQQRIEAAILPPPGVGIDATEGLALSPDGKQLIFVGRDAAGIGRLWLRPLDRGEATPLDGTEGASDPFWSPGARFVGFVAQGKLRKLELATGIVESIADVAGPYGAAWADDGSIVIGRQFGDGLWRISSNDGVGSRLTERATKGDSHQWPSFLPDGKHFLYLVRSYGTEAARGELWLGSLDGGAGKPLFPSNSHAVWAPPGYIVWWHDGNLRARRFDADRLELVGEAFSVAAGVTFDPRDGFAGFAISRTGVLVYQTGGMVSGNQLVWVDRDGTESETVGPAGSLYSPALSPDGTQVTLDVSDETNRGNIWVFDTANGTGTPLSNFPEDDSDPEWSIDGREIAFFSMHGADQAVIYVRPARGAGEARLLVQDDRAALEPTDWIDGRMLVERQEPGDSRDLYLYSFDDETLDPFRATEFDEYDAQFSPDGRWVVYTSNETGTYEIYVEELSDSRARMKVSIGGGTMPTWRPGGGELFFVSPDNEMMSVAVGTGPDGLTFAAPRRLFRVDIKASPSRQYDTIDGKRFLINRNVRSDPSLPLTLVLDWAHDRE